MFSSTTRRHSKKKFLKSICFGALFLTIALVLCIAAIILFRKWVTHSANGDIRATGYGDVIEVSYGYKPNRVSWDVYPKQKGIKINDTQFLGVLPVLKELNSKYATGQVRLYLQESDITDLSLKEIYPFPEIYLLVLKNTNISDEGVLALNSLPGLRGLNLSGTYITDRSLCVIDKIAPDLQGLMIQETACTPKAVLQLKQVMPRATVIDR